MEDHGCVVLWHPPSCFFVWSGKYGSSPVAGKGGIITRLKGGTDEIILGHVHVAVVAAPSR